jgi:hypothetical protein
LDAGTPAATNGKVLALSLDLMSAPKPFDIVGEVEKHNPINQVLPLPEIFYGKNQKTSGERSQSAENKPGSEAQKVPSS